MRRRIVIISLAAFFLINWPGQIPTASVWQYEDCGGFKSYGERLEFQRLLKKHGLHKQISIIYDWPEKPYFVDAKGRRCAFK